MGKLRDQMIEDLQLRDYARRTCKEYVSCAQAFVAYHRRPPQQMGELEIRQFLMHLVEKKKAGPATRKMHVAGIKFLYQVVLRRPEVVAAIPWPKVAHNLPEILSGSEVVRLLDAIDSTKQRAIVMTAYGAGLRISEVCGLKVLDIDSKRMTIRVHGKGDASGTSSCRSGCCSCSAATGSRSVRRGHGYSRDSRKIAPRRRRRCGFTCTRRPRRWDCASA